MCSIRGTLLLLLGLLQLVGCATTGTSPGEAESATAEVVVVADIAITTEQDAARHEALQMVLEVMRAGEWQTALELSEELITNYPTMAEAYANLGNIHWRLGAGEKAEEAWIRALELRPGWASVCNQMGLFYRERGSFIQALSMYQQALAADEGYARAHRNLAILYEIYLGEGTKALQHYRRYQELSGGGGQGVDLWIADLERRVARGDE